MIGEQRLGRGVEEVQCEVSASIFVWWLLGGLVAVAGGCTFDRSAGAGRCEQGARSAGKVCKGNRWVDPDAAAPKDGAVGNTGGGGDVGPVDVGGDACGAGGCVEDGGGCSDASDGGCGCTPGTTRPCYGGPAGTVGIGICEPGEATCRSDGTWGPCQGAVRPTEEVCGDGLDNNCSGESDEGCGEERCNYLGKTDGVCADVEAEDDSCPEPEAYEEIERSCGDQLDNDCDGEVDEADRDCNRRAGEGCSNDGQCRGLCVEAGDEDLCAHRVFVTSDQSFQGDLGGLSGADGICNQLAQDASLEGTWAAVMSDSNNAARDRLQVVAPIYTVRPNSGMPRRVAEGESDLWDGGIEHPIDVSESGSTVETMVWSGTNRDGTRDGSMPGDPGQNCDDWSTNQANIEAEAGMSRATDGDWILATLLNNRNCNRRSALYCIDGQ